jgi:hypothetical protein
MAIGTHITVRILLAAAVLASSGCVTESRSDGDVTANSVLDGQWGGVMITSPAPFRAGQWNWKSGSPIRLELSGNHAKLEIVQGSGWRDFGRPLTVVRQDTNAVVTSIASGTDDTGKWIETWTLSVTRLDATHLEIVWIRQVNNKFLQRNDPNAAWSVLGYGELTPIKNGKASPDAEPAVAFK